MSAIVVVLDRRGERLNPQSFEKVFESVGDRGPDGHGFVVEGSIGLGHHLLGVTYEEMATTQPVVLDEKIAVFDGRLDNRDELLGALSLRAGQRVVSDAELALRAWAEWGSTCVERMLGEFGFAVWDGRTQALFCARDQIGSRPIYYFADGRTLVLSTDIRAVLAAPGVSLSPNERHVAELLLEELSNHTDTLYEGVLRLPAAHTLAHHDGDLSVRRYWDPDLNRESDANSNEHLEHFVDLVDLAITARLRTSSTAAIALSGGLDSSLVATRASTLAPGVVSSASLIFPGLPCDESEWIAAVVESLALDSLRIPWSPLTWEEMIESSSNSKYLAPYPNTTLDMFARGGLSAKTLLTGIGGDEWTCGSSAYFVDCWARRDFGELFRSVCHGGAPAFAEAALAGLRAKARRANSPSLRRNERSPEPAWLGPALRGRAQASTAPPSAAFASASDNAHRARYYTLTDYWSSFCFDLRDRAASFGGFTSTDVFHDRRIIEFACALPESERWHGSDDRWLMRRALRDRVPPQVWRRRTKVGFNAAAAVQVDRLDLDRKVPTFRCVEWGWVALPRQLGGFTRTTPSAHEPWVRPWWSIAAVEAWIRAVWG